MILAAGFGQRMLALSADLPKPIMPLWHTSLLARNMHTLHTWGVREFLVNSHHGATAVFDAARTACPDGCRLTFVHEPTILGTGGGVKNVAWFFGDAPFWLMNADVVALRLDPAPFLERLRRRGTIAACWVDTMRGPRSLRIQRGVITDFATATPGTRGTATFCGLHVIQPDLLRYLPATGFASIIDAYRRAIACGARVAAVEQPNAFWADVGTPARYLQAHWDTAADFANQDVRIDCCVDPSARVHARATCRRTVVWPRAIVGPKADLTDAIVGRHAQINESGTGLITRAITALTPAEADAVIKHHPAKALNALTAITYPARGSRRNYVRITDSQHRLMLMRFDPQHEENARFAPNTRFLRRHRWPVPRILAASASPAAWLLLEDVGHRSLQDLVAENSESALRLYEQVIDHIARLHGPLTEAALDAGLPLMPAFGATLYRYERDLFCNQFLAQHAHGPPTRIDTIREALKRVARLLQRAPLVVLHRDLQSSNIHVRGNRPVFIDYQGMRLGPAAYDIASLLCDPYVRLPDEWRASLLNRYQKNRNAVPLDLTIYGYARIQRLCQALGAFARLGATPQGRSFTAHIPAALAELARALEEGPQLPALHDWVQELLSPNRAESATNAGNKLVPPRPVAPQR